MELLATQLLYNNSIDHYGPILSKAEFTRQGDSLTSKTFFQHSQGGFEFHNSDNCTSCCNTKNNIFYFVSESNKYFNTVPSIESDHIKLVGSVPSNEKIKSIRQHWNAFQECVIINKRSRISSPSHLLEII